MSSTNTPSPLPAPMALNLMKRRKVQYRLRRRQFLDLPAEEPTVADSVAAEGGEVLTLDSAELTRLRDRVRYAEEAAARSQAERQTAMGRAQEAEKRASGLEVEAKEAREKLRQSEQLLDEARRVADQAKAQVVRSRQDLEQQRKRFTKESIDLRQFAAEGVLRELFPVLDHFNYAIETLAQNPSPESLTQGILLIHRELTSVLGAAGLEQVLPLGQRFDPQQHDAAATAEDPRYPDGCVAQVLRPGYVLNGKTLRPAMVAVNKLPQSEAPAPPDDHASIGFAEPIASSDEVPMLEPEEDTAELPKNNPLNQAMRFMDTRFDD